MDSVYTLMNSLCESMFNEQQMKCDRKAIRICRKRAFEILFETGNASATNGSQLAKMMEEFRVFMFEQRLNADTVRKSFRIGQLEALMGKIEVSPLDETSTNVLELLFQLRESSPDDLDPMPPFLTPLPEMPVQGSYAPIPAKLFAPTADMQKLQANNPYMKQNTDDSTLSDILNTRMANFDNKELEQGKYFNITGHGNTFNSAFIRSYRKPEQSIEVVTQRRSSRRGSRRNRILNWENLGSKVGNREPPFATECSSLLSLLCIRSQKFREEFHANLISMDDFLVDVKYLTVGIGSESFVFNSELTFSMVPNLTVDGVAPKTFKGAVDEFVEIGTCFKRMQLMMMRKDPKTFDLIYDGFIFKALCESVESFLITFRKFVLSFEDASLLGFSRRISIMKKQIVALAKVVNIHPTSDSSKRLAVGSKFLGALYRSIIPITQSDVALFLMFILKNCCQVYFSCFEKWLFQGFLVDQYKELFIVFDSGYKEKTKSHFDKAYQIQKHSVPLFLQGWEEDILLCGKYTMLLKQYNSTHPIFTMDRLAVKVCLTHAELDELKRKCEEYLRVARELCGESVSVAVIFKEKHRKREELQLRMAENARIAYEKWQQEQEAKAVAKSKMKAQQREELKLQIEEIRVQKLAEKKANIQRELIYLREAQEIEDQRLIAENIERTKRIQYYEELNRLIEEKHERSEKLIAKLKSDDHDGIMAMSIGSDNFSPEEDTRSMSNPSIPEAIEVPQNTLVIEQLLKKSESDILNANHLDSEFERNRKKVMGSTLIDQLNLELPVRTIFATGTEAQRNKLRVLTHEYNITEEVVRDHENNPKRELTEAERNKINAMSHEFGISLEDVVLLPKGDLTEADRNRAKIMGSWLDEEEQSCYLSVGPLTVLQRNRKKIMNSDFNLPEQQLEVHVGEMTDLQRNRKKVMSQEFNLFEGAEDPPKLRLNLNTDRARNRKKVMESEFNIITADTPSPEFELPRLEIVTDDNIPERFGIPNTATLEQPTPDTAVDGPEPFRFSPKKVVSTSKPSKDKPNDTRDEFIKIIERKMNSLMPLYMPSPAKALRQAPQPELRSLDVTTLTKFLQSSLVLPLNAHMEIVNGEILKLFLLDLDVIGHFKSLRNYFFMMDGEFASCVCDGLLKKIESGAEPKDLLAFQTLHSLLDNALGSSIIGDDKNTEKLSFKVSEVPESFDLWSPDALNMLSLHYQIAWPLNLILNPETLQQYCHIFKHLLKVRRLGWVLEESFQFLKETQKKLGTNILRAPQYRRIQEVRHKLTQFMHALLNHITRAALQGSWKKFKDDLQDTTNMEQIYRKHVSYIKRILFLLMLKPRCRPFKQCLDEIFTIILHFYRNLIGHEFIDETHPKFDEIVKIERNFEAKVEYMIYLGNKMINSGFQLEIAEFLNLININNFYKAKKAASEGTTPQSK